MRPHYLPAPNGAVIASPHISRGVRELIRSVGERVASAQLGLGRQTLARLVGSMPCRRATVDIVRIRLERLATSVADGR
jgi:hypothetical protein